MKNLKHILWIALLLVTAVRSFGQDAPKTLNAADIQALLKKGSTEILYPRSIERFYRQRDFRPVWLANLKEPKQTWQALLLLDCVLQFGLQPADYHPRELTYDLLQAAAKQNGEISVARQARFEVLLTDAMISIMNHLHYGKLNPTYTADRTDNGMDVPFRADLHLQKILDSTDLFTAIEHVQPQSAAYHALQYWMRKWKGRYTEDCYEIPEGTVRQVALNMERLRWADIDDSKTYLIVNIPSKRLTYHRPDSDHVFILASSAQVPGALVSQINYLMTPGKYQPPANQPEQATTIAMNQPANRLMFRIAGHPDIYLYDDNPNQPQKLMAQSAGIGIKQGQELATRLLRADGQAIATKELQKAIKQQKREEFVFRRPIAVKITYITCAVIDGQLVTYKDDYHADALLEKAFYTVAH